MASELVIVFENPPGGAEAARFMEVEDAASGESVEIKWRQWSNDPEIWVLGSFARYEDVVDLEAEVARLRDGLVRKYLTNSGTPWQACRVCREANAQIYTIEHAADCVLAEHPK